MTDIRKTEREFQDAQNLDMLQARDELMTKTSRAWKSLAKMWRTEALRLREFLLPNPVEALMFELAAENRALRTRVNELEAVIARTQRFDAAQREVMAQHGETFRKLSYEEQRERMAAITKEFMDANDELMARLAKGPGDE